MQKLLFVQPSIDVSSAPLLRSHTHALSPHRVQKKKLWEAVQPELRTTAEGVASYKDLPMLTSAGAVTVKRILNGRIS
jgi:hypothetical protein